MRRFVGTKPAFDLFGCRTGTSVQNHVVTVVARDILKVIANFIP